MYEMFIPASLNLRHLERNVSIASYLSSLNALISFSIDIFSFFFFPLLSGKRDFFMIIWIFFRYISIIVIFFIKRARYTAGP